MRLVTYSQNGASSIGLELDDGILDLPAAASNFGSDFHLEDGFPNKMMDLLKTDSGVEKAREIQSGYNELPEEKRPPLISRDTVKYRAPINRPGKIVALGLNYKDHIEETGRDVPDFPVIFAKFPSSVADPDEEIPIPQVTEQLDWEVELGIVIGTNCKNVTEDDALDYVAGYTIINDLSARDLQNDDGQWIRGKSLDGLCPMGPCIVTTDELGTANNLKMHTKVNGTIKQESTTANLLFGVQEIVSYLSKSFTLEAGDIIATGTPSGVGFARDPPEFLKPGDEVELYIEGIGKLRNKII
ncbi:MAG: fumarylacetoacetate hydrolase family protein [Candidatus Thorarchaeota archaeon]|nr:fumarylacetoacetate hydrolase family protein [Candidatus Thorarchaeota archaeon]